VAANQQGSAKTEIVKARVRHNDGKASIYLVVRSRNIDRTLLGQDGIARPLRHARIRCEGSAVYFAKHQARKKHSALRPASSAAGMLSKTGMLSKK
jgi:hypothetical protein